MYFFPLFHDNVCKMYKNFYGSWKKCFRVSTLYEVHSAHDQLTNLNTMVKSDGKLSMYFVVKDGLLNENNASEDMQLAFMVSSVEDGENI